MKPRSCTAQTAEMFRPCLDEQLNMKHPLIRLAGVPHAPELKHEVVLACQQTNASVDRGCQTAVRKRL